MPTNDMITEAPRGGEIDNAEKALVVRPGEPFTIIPHIIFPIVGKELISEGLPLDTVNIYVEGLEKNGSIAINGGRMGSRGWEPTSQWKPPIIFPFGVPAVKMRIDPETGLYIIDSLPLSISISIGKMSEEQNKSLSIIWQVGGLTLEGMKRYTALGTGFVDEPGIAYRERFIDPTTGNNSSIYIPSENYESSFASSPFILELR